MKRVDLHHGGDAYVVPSHSHPGCVFIGGFDNEYADGAIYGIHLTPDEARGLAQRLLKEAAEVEFAGKCVAASEGVES